MAIATLTIDMVAKLANLERDMGKAAHIAEKNAAKMDAAFKTVATSLAAIGATLTVGAFASMVTSVADAGDALQKLSLKTGVAVEELSRLQYAASLSDLSNEDLGASLIKLNRVMGEAADGSKEATAALARFGIAPDAGLNAADALKKIADRVKATGDETKIASGLNDVFGKSFAGLIPLLKGGADGLKDSGDELERMGGVMSGDLAKSSEAFNDNLTKIGRSLDALKVSSLSGAVTGLEKLTGQMIAAEKAAGGLWKGLALWATVGGNESDAPGKSISELTSKIEALKKTRDDLAKPSLANTINNFLDNDVSVVDKQISLLTKKVALLKTMQRDQALVGGDNYGNEGRGNSSGATTPGIADAVTKKAKEKAQAYTDLLTPAAEAYAKTIEKINAAELSAEKSTRALNGAQESLFELMSSTDWQKMPEAWQQVAIAQAAASTIAIEAADSQKKLNDLLAATPTAQIELAQADMLLLADALERGAISAEQFQEAAIKRLDLGSEAIEKQKSLAEELGLTFTSAFEDAVAGGKSFSDVLKGIEQDIIKLLVRKTVTEPLLEGVKGFDFGSIFSGLFANAKGGVYTSPSLHSYVNTVQTSPKTFAFANGGVFAEAGPEAIMPLSRGPDGKLGVKSSGGAGVVVNINNPPGTRATQSTRQDAGGKTVIDVMIETVKDAIAGDISSGGKVAGAMENQYGLNRAAGAWR